MGNPRRRVHTGQYTYDVYGEPKIWDGGGNLLSGSAIGNRLMFQGRDRDPHTSLYNFRNRYYSPSSGRFAQVDRMRFLRSHDPLGVTCGLSLYDFAHNCPTMVTDVYGMLSSDEEAVHQITAFFKKLKEMVDKAKTCQEVLEQLKDAVEKGKTAGAKGSSILAAAFGLGGLPAGMVDLMEQFLKIPECTQMITCCKNRDQAGCSEKADGCALDLAVRMAGSTSPITGVVADKVLSEIFHEELCGEK